MDLLLCSFHSYKTAFTILGVDQTHCNRIIQNTMETYFRDTYWMVTLNPRYHRHLISVRCLFLFTLHKNILRGFWIFDTLSLWRKSRVAQYMSYRTTYKRRSVAPHNPLLHGRISPPLRATNGSVGWSRSKLLRQENNILNDRSQIWAKESVVLVAG